MKKAYTLFITIFLITLFSILGIFILETKSLRSETLTNQYLFIQAKNHKIFLKDYLNNTDLTNITHIEIKDDLFNIYAQINHVGQTLLIDLFIKAKEHDISLHEQFSKIN